VVFDNERERSTLRFPTSRMFLMLKLVTMLKMVPTVNVWQVRCPRRTWKGSPMVNEWSA